MESQDISIPGFSYYRNDRKKISFFRQQVSRTILWSYQKLTVARRENIFFQKINKIDYESFHSDILSSDLIKKPENDLSALCQQYDSVLSSILDKHAPVSTKTLPRKPPTPEVMKAKTLRHYLERTWCRSRTHLDCTCYKHQCHLCNRMMTKAKSKYLADVIAENSDNPRRLWSSISNIL